MRPGSAGARPVFPVTLLVTTLHSWYVSVVIAVTPSARAGPRCRGGRASLSSSYPDFCSYIFTSKSLASSRDSLPCATSVSMFAAIRAISARCSLTSSCFVLISIRPLCARGLSATGRRAYRERRRVRPAALPLEDRHDRRNQQSAS